MRAIHMEDTQKKFICTHCGKGFEFKNKLDGHIMNMHLKLRPYKCRYGCADAYNDKSNLAAHEKKKHGGYFGGKPPPTVVL